MKTDCFAYHEVGRRCQALIEDVCKKHECPFYKTKEQYNSDLIKYKKNAEARKHKKVI